MRQRVQKTENCEIVGDGVRQRLVQGDWPRASSSANRRYVADKRSRLVIGHPPGVFVNGCPTAPQRLSVESRLSKATSPGKSTRHSCPSDGEIENGERSRHAMPRGQWFVGRVIFPDAEPRDQTVALARAETVSCQRRRWPQRSGTVRLIRAAKSTVTSAMMSAIV